MSAAPADPFRVLVVCTGNICRSAFAERLGRAWIGEALGDDASELVVESAGTRAVVGSAMHPDSALVLRGYGVEADGFRARQLAEEHPAQADLVLTMTRAHRNQVLGLAPRALARTFTLREAAALLSALDDLEPEGDDFVARARALVRAMADARPGRSATRTDDDVWDPINQPIEAHEEAGELIVETFLPLLRRLADLRSAEACGTAAAEEPAAR
ncbi:protein-tyrosine-phosphatase [Blastococcus litoris]|uniref:arsenate reductase/protein-tyrosine-phosphatase family protein n=1 Tax=Blastococcus litoris TaxID=2171622 RepID=UPI0013DF6A4C|nr:protein-tyrosine-phosphatase [Blastococcus litoris]